MELRSKSSKLKQITRRLKRPLAEDSDSTQSGEKLVPDVLSIKSQNSSLYDLGNLNDTVLVSETSPKGFSDMKTDFSDMCTPLRGTGNKSSQDSEADQYISLLSSLNKSSSVMADFDINSDKTDNFLFTPSQDSRITPKNDRFTHKQTRGLLKNNLINDFSKLKDTPSSNKYTPVSQKVSTSSYNDSIVSYSDIINSYKDNVISNKDIIDLYKECLLSQTDTQFSQNDITHSHNEVTHSQNENVISYKDTQFSQNGSILSRQDTEYSLNDVVIPESETQFSQNDFTQSQNEIIMSQNDIKILDEDFSFEGDTRFDNSAKSNYSSFKKTCSPKENSNNDFGSLCDILSLDDLSDVNFDKPTFPPSNCIKSQTNDSDETDTSSSSSGYVTERRQTRSQYNKKVRQKNVQNNARNNVEDNLNTLLQTDKDDSVNLDKDNSETKTNNLKTKSKKLDERINKSDNKSTNLLDDKERVLRLGCEDNILYNKYGIRYEPMDKDVRRKYKSFEQLCFGLGCLVSPTKQELEMCKQLSTLSDPSALSHYETSVYQGCILRSRAFETIWRKFCNRVLGIVRRYILKGTDELVKIIESQELIEPFLKLVLIDLGTDRQDQQLFLNILQEELNNLIKHKYILIRVNNNNNLNDIIKQMYIQLYTHLLKSNNVNVGTTTNTNILSKLIHLYNSFINKCNTNTPNTPTNNANTPTNTNLNEGYEFVIVVDKLNEYINDILYLFEMIKRRKLLPINSIIVISSNSEYIEKYCNTRIYSNLGIFECRVLTVSNIVEEILQVLMFDVYVQDFIPNFRILLDLYDQYNDMDNSFTLLIMRVYQMYEQYYNSFIFSYLSILPTHFFKFTNSEDYYTDILLDSEINSQPKTDNNLDKGQQMHLDKTLNSYTDGIDKLSNKKLVNDGSNLSNNNNLADNGNKLTKNSNNVVSDNKMATNGMEIVVDVDKTEAGLFDNEIVIEDDPKPKENKLELYENDVYNENGVNILELLDIKNLYSVYSLLCVGNNMNESSVGYFDVKLGVSLPLEKIILEYLPLNTVILVQRRILFQLGVHLLFKTLDFLPEFYNFKNKILQLANNFDNYKDVINKLVDHFTTLCSEDNLFCTNSLIRLKRLFNNFNKYYSRYKNLLIKIEIFLNSNNVKGIKARLDDLNRTIRVSNSDDFTSMINDFKDKLTLCLFPPLSSFPLTKILLVQKYSQIITSNVGNNSSAINSNGSGDGLGNTGFIGLDVILHINKYIKYKIINMWKLFIIYYYILTGMSSDKKSESSNPQDIIEIYISFNNNIEILEKLYKIAVVNNTNSSERISQKSQQYDSGDKDLSSSVDRMDRINGVDKVEAALSGLGSVNVNVYKDIKKSLMNISVKFL